jgi:hypothetical protein
MTQFDYPEQTTAVDENGASIFSVEVLPSLPSLKALMADVGPMLPYTALIGACEDGFHCFMDLRDPKPGAVLITSQHGQGMQQLLQALLTSACWLNPPDCVRLNLVSMHTARWTALTAYPHLNLLAAPYQVEASQLVMSLSEIAEQRRSGRLLGPAILLGVDDLVSFVKRMDEDALLYFRWLLREGARSQVWVVATLGAGEANQLDRQMLADFRTRLIGEDHPAQYRVRLQGEWVRFWVPSLA